MNTDFPLDSRAELEARVTAMLLGELTTEETAALQEIMAHDAELAKLHEQLRMTLDLVRETAATPAGTLAEPPAPLRLSPARREALLAQFKTVEMPQVAQPQARRRSYAVPLAVAAAIILMATVVFGPKLGEYKRPGVLADLVSDQHGKEDGAIEGADVRLSKQQSFLSPAKLASREVSVSGHTATDVPAASSSYSANLRATPRNAPVPYTANDTANRLFTSVSRPNQPGAAEKPPTILYSTNSLAANNIYVPGITTDEGKGLVPNFRGVPVDSALKYMADSEGFTIVRDVDTRSAGNVDLVSQVSLDKDETVGLLNKTLAKDGLTAVQDGKNLEIMTTEQAKLNAGSPVVVWSGTSANVPSDSTTVTEIIPLRSLNPTQVTKELLAAKTPGVEINANEGGNAISVTAPQSEVKRIEEKLGELDKSDREGVATFGSQTHEFRPQFANQFNMQQRAQQAAQSSTLNSSSSQLGWAGQSSTAADDRKDGAKLMDTDKLAKSVEPGQVYSLNGVGYINVNASNYVLISDQTNTVTFGNASLGLTKDPQVAAQFYTSDGSALGGVPFNRVTAPQSVALPSDNPASARSADATPSGNVSGGLVPQAQSVAGSSLGEPIAAVSAAQYGLTPALSAAPPQPSQPAQLASANLPGTDGIGVATRRAGRGGGGGGGRGGRRGGSGGGGGGGGGFGLSGGVVQNPVGQPGAAFQSTDATALTSDDFQASQEALDKAPSSFPHATNNPFIGRFAFQTGAEKQIDLFGRAEPALKPQAAPANTTTTFASATNDGPSAGKGVGFNWQLGSPLLNNDAIGVQSDDYAALNNGRASTSTYGATNSFGLADQGAIGISGGTAPQYQRANPPGASVRQMAAVEKPELQIRQEEEKRKGAYDLAAGNITRLNADGSLDQTFNAGSIAKNGGSLTDDAASLGGGRRARRSAPAGGAVGGGDGIGGGGFGFGGDEIAGGVPAQPDDPAVVGRILARRAAENGDGSVTASPKSITPAASDDKLTSGLRNTSGNLADANKQAPVLGDVPLLGNFFKRDVTASQKDQKSEVTDLAKTDGENRYSVYLPGAEASKKTEADVDLYVSAVDSPAAAPAKPSSGDGAVFSPASGTYDLYWGAQQGEKSQATTPARPPTQQPEPMLRLAARRVAEDPQTMASPQPEHGTHVAGTMVGGAVDAARARSSAASSQVQQEALAEVDALRARILHSPERTNELTGTLVVTKSLPATAPTEPANIAYNWSLPVEKVLGDIYGPMVGRTPLYAPGIATAKDAVITLKTQSNLTKSEAIQALETTIGMNGITIVPVGDKYFKVVTEASAPGAGGNYYANTAASLRDSGKLVTEIVELKDADPAQTVAALGKLSKSPNSVIYVPSTKSLILRDYPENVNRMLDVLAEGSNHGSTGVSPSQVVTKVDAPAPIPSPAAPTPQPEIQTATNAFSTFSLNVSDVSFKLAAASLANGKLPESGSVRSEEFINAFDYRDAAPAPGAPIGFAWERAEYPFAHNRDLLRFAVKTAAQGRQASRPLNLVLLLDKSGSMERADRVAIIREALRVLGTELQPQDTISVVVFARMARLWADGLSGSQAGGLAASLEALTPEGGTNLEEAMKLAYETALRHYRANGENRVVVLTDGAANLGDVKPEDLKKQAEDNRAQGIALDCFGVGWDDYNDNLLEALSRAGGGRYGFVNTPEEADSEFAGQLAGALRVAASDVKVQVEFNPSRVTSYRQIGYAKDKLTKEQFRDNTVKAAQLSVEEAGNALYTVELNAAGDGPVCTVHVRYRTPGTQDYTEHAWDVPYNGASAALDQASPAMRLAATASAFSEWLAASPYSGEVTLDQLQSTLRGVPEYYGVDARPRLLATMISEARSISGK